MVLVKTSIGTFPLPISVNVTGAYFSHKLIATSAAATLTCDGLPFRSAAFAAGGLQAGHTKPLTGDTAQLINVKFNGST
jgi:hypothetical protein